MSIGPSPALGLGWFGHRPVAPPAAPVCWALLGSRFRRSVALASGRTLSLCFSRLGFLPWAFVRAWVGRLRSCLGSCLLLGKLSFPCPGFRLAVPAVWLSRILQFSWSLCLGSFLSLPVFADSLGWLRMVLGCPPSVAWRRRLLPWFSVRYWSACPRGAAVPLDPSVLRCSWSSRCGHLSQVGTVFFLSPRSWRRLSLLLVGLTPGLRAGSPASGWRCVLRHALVRVAVPPSHGLVLLLRTGFLFSGPGWCGRVPPFSFSSVFLRDVVTLWGQ